MSHEQYSITLNMKKTQQVHDFLPIIQTYKEYLSTREWIKLTYLQDSLRHSGFKHLNILSCSSGIIVAKLQNGHATRLGMSACLISSSCVLRNTRENIEVDRTSWSMVSGKTSSHVPDGI